jgi:sirohydrochlorin cobaltochelatase
VAAVKEAFPGVEVRQAFTSRQVVSILRDRDGEAVDLVPEALDRYRHDGYTRLAVQPLHLLPGHEFHNKIVEAVAESRTAFESIRVGMPLLTGHGDLERVVDVIADQLTDNGAAAVLMGHGSDHPSGALYSTLQLLFDDRGLPVRVGTVEGYPDFDRAVRTLPKETTAVVLRPLMLVAGEHVRNDMIGPHPESWKARLEAMGYTVSADTRGLGELPEVRRIFVQHLKTAFGGAT